MINFTEYEAANNVQKHMRGVSTITKEGVKGLLVSPGFAKNNLKPETLHSATLLNGSYFFIDEEYLKPLADSKKIRESVMRLKLESGWSPEKIEKKVIKELSNIDPGYLECIGIKPDKMEVEKLNARKSYERRVESKCPATIIASSGDSETLIAGVIKIHTADGGVHFAMKEDFDRQLDKCGFLEAASLHGLDLVFKEGLPPVEKLIRKYVLDLAICLIDEMDDDGPKSRARCAHAFNGSVLDAKNIYLKRMQECGFTWGEGIISFCDELRGVAEELPRLLVPNSIF